MDSVKRSEVTPRKSRLSRTFAKVLHIRSLTVPLQKKRHDEEIKKDYEEEDEDDELRDMVVKEAFLAKLFASVSVVKAAYAQMQFAQCPYDADGIQEADKVVVSELRSLSEMKQAFLKEQLNDITSPENSIVSSEIQEQKSLLKTYEITCKKLDSQIKLKDSEIIFLQEKLEEANRDIKSLEKRLNSSGRISMPENIQLSELRPSHFIEYLRPAVKSIRSFVRLLVNEMEASEWDLDAAAGSIEPGVSFWKPNHKCFAFESFVSKGIFDGFNRPSFSTKPSPETENLRRAYFARFTEMKSITAEDYFSMKRNSTFAKFCRAKYLKLVHPKMEASLFGNLEQRNLVISGKIPETPFFTAFSEMAKRVWVLHCLAMSFEAEVSVFQASRGNRFSEVYMESLSDEAFWSPESEPTVAFTVVPGFRIGKTIIQCQVYLRR